MQPRWFVARDRVKYGPYSHEQLRQGVESGRIQPTDMMLQEGSQKWVEASSLAWLFPTPVSTAATPSGTGAQPKRRTGSTRGGMMPILSALRSFAYQIFGAIAAVVVCVAMFFKGVSQTAKSIGAGVKPASAVAKISPNVAKSAAVVAKRTIPLERRLASFSRTDRKWEVRADDLAEVYQRYRQLSEMWEESPRERFPHPASSVVPNSPDWFLVDEQFGIVAVRNNYDGFSFYDGDGNPLGFSAWNIRLREERYFDRFGDGL